VLFAALLYVCMCYSICIVDCYLCVQVCESAHPVATWREPQCIR